MDPVWRWGVEKGDALDSRLLSGWGDDPRQRVIGSEVRNAESWTRSGLEYGVEIARVD